MMMKENKTVVCELCINSQNGKILIVVGLKHPNSRNQNNIKINEGTMRMTD